ncbi:putative germin-like protein 9-2 [Capsicum baccatum]|uniref:Germin-like protein n=1 Tax=Capsicum baccatum TaxID=33114 RepID=A0A2G2VER6_CAPBA|nr:putative germin-like protein 9-2 [Capsicum baccatum]PHT98080.1 putative germin-like protein 9-2 [Capsicum chinense]
MAWIFIKSSLFLLISIFTISISRTTIASDPDILSDFIAPEKQNSVDANFFTYTAMRGIFQKSVDKCTTTKATKAEFPVLNGQGVSLAVLQFPPGSVNPPHYHSRATGLFLLLEGVLEVGFVDTKDVLYTQRLKAGDIFLFPKGLQHYQYNFDPKKKAVGVAALGSASPGTVSLPSSIFNSGISELVLAKSFKTDVKTIKKIKTATTTP